MSVHKQKKVVGKNTIQCVQTSLPSYLLPNISPSYLS